MIFGDRACVAIEISIERTIEQWVYGHFLLWLGGRSVGNKQDCGADLKGCINWLSDFLTQPRDRCAADLMLASKEVVWRKLVEPVFKSAEADARYSDAFSRFHLSHLGMSAFDKVTLVALNDGRTSERYLWQQDKEGVTDFTAPLGSLATSAREAILWFQQLNSPPATPDS